VKEKCYNVHFNNDDNCFEVTKHNSDDILVFHHSSKRLYYHNINTNDSASYSILNSTNMDKPVAVPIVDDNKSKYSSEQVKRADEARRLYITLRWPG